MSWNRCVKTVTPDGSSNKDKERSRDIPEK